MTQNNIKFRPIQKSDYRAIEKIISDTWKYETFCSPKTARKLGKLYLSSCFIHQTFTCVALNNDEPVGVIMCNDEKTHRTPLRYNVYLFWSLLIILCCREGRGIIKKFSIVNKSNEALLDSCTQHFDGEVAFFVIKSGQRGMGIGKELFNRGLEYLKGQNIQNFYLYTDTTCDFSFYEHKGMTRFGEMTRDLTPYRKELMNLFIYGGTLN